MQNKLVRVELINPQPTGSWAEGDGQRWPYTSYEMPQKITSAIGLACSGRTMCTCDGTIPAVWCEDHGDYLVAVRWDHFGVKQAVQVVRAIMENFPEASEGMSLRCTDWAYRDLDFTFVDVEESKTYELGRDQLLKAFYMIRSNKWPAGCTKPPASNTVEAWMDWCCQADAIDFDAFVQLACLGEVIYG